MCVCGGGGGGGGRWRGRALGVRGVKMNLFKLV